MSKPEYYEDSYFTDRVTDLSPDLLVTSELIQLVLRELFDEQLLRRHNSVIQTSPGWFQMVQGGDPMRVIERISDPDYQASALRMVVANSISECLLAPRLQVETEEIADRLVRCYPELALRVADVPEEGDVALLEELDRAVGSKYPVVQTSDASWATPAFARWGRAEDHLFGVIYRVPRAEAFAVLDTPVLYYEDGGWQSNDQVLQVSPSIESVFRSCFTHGLSTKAIRPFAASTLGVNSGFIGGQPPVSGVRWVAPVLDMTGSEIIATKDSADCAAAQDVYRVLWLRGKTLTPPHIRSYVALDTDPRLVTDNHLIFGLRNAERALIAGPPPRLWADLGLGKYSERE